MDSILKDLFLGNLSPNDRSFRKDSEFGRALHQLCEKETALLSLLDEDQEKLLKSFQAAQSTVNYLEQMDRFIYGFRLGLMLAIEAYHVSDTFVVGGV